MFINVEEEIAQKSIVGFVFSSFVLLVKEELVLF